MGPLMYRPTDLQTYIAADLQTYRPTVHWAPGVQSIYAAYMGPLICTVYGAPDVQTYRPTDLQTYRPTDLQTYSTWAP
jgi:hypothetical protein